MENDILQEITRITRENGFRLTGHARDQMTARKLNTSLVKDILLNPRRLIRVDCRENDTYYKIQGGRFNRKLAVVIKDKVIVVTVM
ncbi:hypothetical protein DCCM_3757 [Desulfocucumis palustris]|uniref:DUF4258 domain-containing protein n=1 Tax=Desulfocucumis palustris TaxID=1898651 RepID=A0A2L2XE62_9FIRM|nr:DUF4258 domain-containing protein [Desulfocucumis palustris]GBF34637.1 hypothetical protein DCCM_3757 [Desulfocucumis palustris]